MKIQAFGYDPEADELDLLIDADEPQPAEAVPVDAGVYIRRDPESGRVVGAVIRGYANFLQAMLAKQEIPTVEAMKADLEKEFAAILEWQRKALRLSHDLLTHLGARSGKDQHALVETLLTQAS
jgi:CRISPR/Cas system-associated protein Csm6